MQAIHIFYGVVLGLMLLSLWRKPWFSHALAGVLAVTVFACLFVFAGATWIGFVRFD